jgi:hypothetical protein
MAGTPLKQTGHLSYFVLISALGGAVLALYIYRMATAWAGYHWHILAYLTIHTGTFNPNLCHLPFFAL